MRGAAPPRRARTLSDRRAAVSRLNRVQRGGSRLSRTGGTRRRAGARRPDRRAWRARSAPGPAGRSAGVGRAQRAAGEHWSSRVPHRICGSALEERALRAQIADTQLVQNGRRPGVARMLGADGGAARRRALVPLVPRLPLGPVGRNQQDRCLGCTRVECRVVRDRGGNRRQTQGPG
jgi:hypothetical protein